VRYRHHHHHHPRIEEIHAMTTKVIHNELVEQTADISTLQPLAGFQFQAAEFMLVTPTQGATPATAINLDTGASVQVPSPNVVILLDLSITITDTPAPVVAPAAAPAAAPASA
jgi:hypothetical protein